MKFNPLEALIFFRLLPSNCLNWNIYCDVNSSLWSNSMRASSPLGSRARFSGARFVAGVREGELSFSRTPAPNLSRLASQSARNPPLAPENLARDPNRELARMLFDHCSLLCYSVLHFSRPRLWIMFRRLIELCSALFKYVRKLRPVTQIFVQIKLVIKQTLLGVSERKTTTKKSIWHECKLSLLQKKLQWKIQFRHENELSVLKTKVTVKKSIVGRK